MVLERVIALQIKKLVAIKAFVKAKRERELGPILITIWRRTSRPGCNSPIAWNRESVQTVAIAKILGRGFLNKQLIMSELVKTSPICKMCV